MKKDSAPEFIDNDETPKATSTNESEKFVAFKGTTEILISISIIVFIAIMMFKSTNFNNYGYFFSMAALWVLSAFTAKYYYHSRGMSFPGILTTALAFFLLIKLTVSLTFLICSTGAPEGEMIGNIKSSFSSFSYTYNYNYKMTSNDKSGETSETTKSVTSSFEPTNIDISRTVNVLKYTLFITLTLSVAYYFFTKIYFSLIPIYISILMTIYAWAFYIADLTGTLPALLQWNTTFILSLPFGILSITVLSVALYFEVKDPKRENKESRIAFWNFAIFGPLFMRFITMNLPASTTLNLIILCLILVFALTLAIVVDRKSFLVTALLYSFIYSDLTPFKTDSGFGTINMILVISFSFILFGTYWHNIRKFIMQKILPNFPYKDRLYNWH